MNTSSSVGRPPPGSGQPVALPRIMPFWGNGRRGCDCCNGVRPDEAVQRRHILDLLAVLDQTRALPPDLALRLGFELLTLTDNRDRHLMCEPVGDARR